MLTENKRDRLADIKARVTMRQWTGVGDTTRSRAEPEAPPSANWLPCVTVGDVEWLVAEVERLWSDVAELLASADADALVITQAGRDQAKLRAALAKLVSVLVQGAYIVYGGDGYDHCLDCYAIEGHSHEADCIYMTVLPDLIRYLELEEQQAGRKAG